MLCLGDTDHPKDTSSLLDFLLEVKLITRQVLPELTQQHIAAMRMSGKEKWRRKH
jgi:hypothetical protein